MKWVYQRNRSEFVDYANVARTIRNQDLRLSGSSHRIIKIGVQRYPANSAFGAIVLFLFLTATIVRSQGVKTPFDPVPASQRALLAKRLNAYTKSFRNQHWGTLYGLVSDANKKVGKRTFIHAMQNSYEMRHLLKFTPVRTESRGLGYDVYGCGELPERDERVSAVRAVWEHGNWFFTEWNCTNDPWEPCSRFSDPAWKPPQPPLSLDGPMQELVCYLSTCEL